MVYERFSTNCIAESHAEIGVMGFTTCYNGWERRHK